MSNVASLHIDRQPSSDHHLGPARILRTELLGKVLLELRDGAQRHAEMALAFRYEPTVGDTVLAIGDADGCYVIGVLHSAGKTVLSVAGDLEINAAGALRLRGEQGVAIEGAQMQVEVGKLEIVARQVAQRFERLRQSVSELLSVRAGATHTVVEGATFTRAREATLLTKDKVNINGKSIHLG